MELQLGELIEQIKKDGVEAAEAEAKSIIDSANADAEKIIASAKSEAEKILANAKLENERMVKLSEDAIRQAGRNLLISFRESVARELKAITEESVTAVYSSEALSEIIIQVIVSLAADPENDDIAVVLNEKDLAALEGLLLAGIKEKMLSGVTLKASENFDGGFRIVLNNGSAYYDYSTDAVVDMLSNYLTPKIVKILKEA
jgi:V/A-type H+-transporting ATPase subunit E